MSTTQNETILIEWNDTMFSENIFAFFEYGRFPIFADKITDVLLPEDYSYNKLEDGVYEIFSYDKECEEYLYTGRLYTPNGNPIEHYLSE